MGPGRCALDDGEVRLLVRPEDLTLTGADSNGATGQVTRRRYYGHDVVSEVRLDAGPTLRVRLAAHEKNHDDERVGVRPRRGTFRVYESGAPGACVGRAEFES